MTKITLLSVLFALPQILLADEVTLFPGQAHEINGTTVLCKSTGNTLLDVFCEPDAVVFNTIAEDGNIEETRLNTPSCESVTSCSKLPEYVQQTLTLWACEKTDEVYTLAFIVIRPSGSMQKLSRPQSFDHLYACMDVAAEKNGLPRPNMIDTTLGGCRPGRDCTFSFVDHPYEYQPVSASKTSSLTARERCDQSSYAGKTDWQVIDYRRMFELADFFDYYRGFDTRFLLDANQYLWVGTGNASYNIYQRDLNHNNEGRYRHYICSRERQIQ